MDIQVKRGVESRRRTFIPKVGEPVFTTDTKELFIGDGSTDGGIPVGTVKPSGSIAADTLAVFTDASGKLLKSLSKVDLLRGLASETFVNQRIAALVPGIKVNLSSRSDLASNARKLNNRSDYLTPDIITTSYQENATNKVVAASGVKALFDNVDSQLSNKLDKSALSVSIVSTSRTTAAASAAVKALNDKISSSVSTLTTTLNTIKTTAASAQNDATKALHQLSRLPGRVSSGTGDPSGGSNGDIYIQYN